MNYVTDPKAIEAIKLYQVPGCVSDVPDDDKFEKDDIGFGWKAHRAGTMMGLFTTFFLGLPKGFCRVGELKDFRPKIFVDLEHFLKEFEGGYDKYDIPVWKKELFEDESHRWIEERKM